jgi:hypothetical protein
MQELSRLAEGMQVTDIGNVPLGRVGRVLANAFDLVLPDGSRIRVSAEALFTVEHARASLICPGSGIRSYADV